jgi:AAA ATPase domain
MGPEHLVQLEVAQRRVRVCWRCGREWPVAREMCPECAVGIAEGERDQYDTHVVTDGAALRSQIGLTQCWPGPPIQLATALVLHLTIEALPSSDRVGGVLEEHLLGFYRIICSYKGWIDSAAAGDLRALFTGENHALQAVRAGLALSAFHCAHPPAVGWESKWRAGINTGLVVWRRDGRPEGRALAIAAELAPLARPGVILVSEAVFRHIEPFYDLVAVGVEGDTSGSAPRYAVLGPKVEDSHALHKQHSGPLIGRQDALAALDAALAALHVGVSQIVSLVAEPDLGKSKLITAWLEAAQQCGALAGVTVLQGLGVAYGSAPGATLRSLLRPQGNMSAAAPEEISSLIERGFLTPPTRIADAFTAWLARQQQVVLVVDDLHWTDDESLVVLRALLERSPPVPLLVVFSFRPSAAARLAWVLSASRLVVHLTPLSPPESQALLHARGGADMLPAAISQALAARVGGNPLYLEEALAFLHDQRAETPGELRAVLTELPATLPGLILARVEHFAARHIAQLSSGLGWLTQHPFERHRRLDEVTTIERELSA